MTTLTKEQIEEERKRLHLHWPQDEFKAAHDALCDMALQSLQQGEAVAWRWKYKRDAEWGIGHQQPWFAGQSGYIAEALYTSPPPPSQALELLREARNALEKMRLIDLHNAEVSPTLLARIDALLEEK